RLPTSGRTTRMGDLTRGERASRTLEVNMSVTNSDQVDGERLGERARELADREMATLLERTPKSKALFERAVHSMPGGVASSFQLGDPYPIYLERGVGADVWDVDGHRYHDFHNGFGSIAVGHAHP